LGGQSSPADLNFPFADDLLGTQIPLAARIAKWRFNTRASLARISESLRNVEFRASSAASVETNCS